MERWQDIEGFPNHQVSDHGNVRRKKAWGKLPALGIVKTQPLKKPGSKTLYRIVKFRYDGVQTTHQVHRLVAKAFIPNPHSLPQVNHKDGNGENNHYSNLEWVTGKQNSEHASRIIYSHAKECIAISPSGEHFHFKNLAQFAEQHGLSKTAVRAVAQGNRRHHKGWQFSYIT